MRKSFTTALLAGLATVVCAQAASPTLPATVAGDLKEIAAQCSEVGGKPNTEQAVKRADLNADGKDDYVLDVGAINCDGAASIFGDRTKSVIVYVGDGAGNAERAFTDSTFGARLEGTGPATKLWLTVMAEGCGRKPAVDFASENFCDRYLVWDAKTRKFDYAPLSKIKMIQ